MTTWRLLIALVASWCLGVAVSAQQYEPQSKPDHMHHRFDDPERYAKSFDESAGYLADAGSRDRRAGAVTERVCC